MKRNGVLLLVALALGVAALATSLLRGDGEEPGIAQPPRASAQQLSMSGAAMPVTVEREVPVAPLDTPGAEQVEEPKQELLPAPPKLNLSAQPLIDAGIAEDIANGMVKAVEHEESSYRSMVQRDEKTSQRYTSEFLFTIWPDLPDLIRRGDVKPEIVAYPPHNWNQPKVSVARSLTLPAGELSYALTMERWVVRLTFTSKSNPKPELFAKILEAANANK